ncbi:ribosome-inactivating family protein [Streptomyces sp. NPDC127036]|uniref:ribosome-inactivating family protein n=1 Tax=Streptomyces sp. NPDC127036 TaxID=3347112 RepID=UPI0036674D57
MRSMVALSVIALVLIGGGASPSSANVPGNQVTFITHELNDDPGAVGRIDGTPGFFQAISQIRAAAGHSYINDVRATQSYQDGIIGIDVRSHTGVELVTLYLNPHSLYISGFQARDNRSYYFSDAPAAAVSEIDLHAQSHGFRAVRLNMTGNVFDWQRMMAAANRPVPATMDVGDFSASASQLGGISPSNVDYSLITIAEAMLIMTPAYSESVIFPDFRDRVGESMTDVAHPFRVMDSFTQELRRERPAIMALMTAECNSFLFDRNHLLPPNGTRNDVHFFFNAPFEDWGDVEREVRMFPGSSSC